MGEYTLRRLYKRIGLYVALLLSFSGVTVFAVGATVDQNSLLFPAVRIGGLELSGLPLDVAREALVKSVKNQLHLTSIFVTVEDKSWQLQPEDIDCSIDELKSVQTAFEEPRHGNLLQRFFALHVIHDFDPVILFNEKKLTALLTTWAKEVEQSAISASIQPDENNQIVITPGKNGRELDQARSLQAIKHAIFTNQSTVALILRDIPPSVTETDLNPMTGLLTEYKTTYSSPEIARSKNITLATKALNGSLLRSGADLSFNTIVGPRSQQRGYQMAPAYINEQLSEDWGGGVCQVSSTLYNAALLADLTIVERSAHYRPAGYVPIGLDATVDFHSKQDLIIRNTLPEAVYVSAEIKENQLIIRLYGKVLPTQPEIQIITTNLVDTEPKTVIVQDANLEPGKQIITQEGQKGFYVSTARIRKMNGLEMSREPLGEDTYNPVDKVIRVGAKTSGKNK